MHAHVDRTILATLVLPFALALGAQATEVGGEPLVVLEPAAAVTPIARKPDRQRWSWNRAHAAASPTGSLTWTPEPFAFARGAEVRHIDFESGDDTGDGTRERPWKHHPWDAAATGNAKTASGVATYVFKRGVVYRGTLVARESGTEAEPIRLTSDPTWGSGEAVIAGSERVTGWTKGADDAALPEAGAVWHADIDFQPRCVWTIEDGRTERVALARIPNWKVSDPADVKSEWWRFQQPNWWENKSTRWKITHGDHRAHLGIDTEHLTEDEAFYQGAIARVEYGIVMGTPYPIRVEAFDAKQKGLVFQGIWTGDTGMILPGCRYFLEDKPQYLDSPGEFWFDKARKRLYLRLPGDRDPNAAQVEVAKRIALIEDVAAAAAPDRLDILSAEQKAKVSAAGVTHLEVSGLAFRFTNVHWDLTLPPWMHKDIATAAIRLRGASDGVRISNCRFADVAKAVRVAPIDERARVGRIVVSDNDIERTDHGAIELRSHATGDFRILRNRLQEIALRGYRQDHSHALVTHMPETSEIAGNIIHRTTASGIFAEAQFGSALNGLSRNLVHHNQATETMLSANDWGGIETNGAPFMVFNNVSGRTGGLWWAHDPKKPGSASLGMAFYWDHGHAIAGFNLIAYGRSNDWTGKDISHAGLYEASATVGNRLFNSTFHRFWTGTQWSPTAGRHLLLGNLFDDIGELAIKHGPLKEDTAAKPSTYPHHSTAYGRNVFSRLGGKEFAVYESSGKRYATPEAMAASFAAHPALASDVGTVASASTLRDPDQLDFRLKPGTPAIDGGVTVFVPWTLALTVGEWHFRRNQADPARLIDDHFCNVPYMTNETQYAVPVFDLRAHGIAGTDYAAGPLEDWCDGALILDGLEQHASIAHADMTKPYTYDAGKNQKKTVEGKDIVSPDIDRSSLLIEMHVRPTAGQGARVLVSKRREAGYQLALNRAGGVTFTVLAGGAKAELASGAVIADGAWHHVVAELDRANGIGSIYTDGVRTANGPMALPADASLSNEGDLLVGRAPEGGGFAGAIEFLRIARTTLAESRTSIEELYDWEFDGPFLRDFAGQAVRGARRDAGALEGDG